MLDDLISVSGLPGLYKMVTNRPNGLIVEAIDSGKRRFCSVRKHQFTPLGSIAIYTVLDTIPLKDVLKKMHAEQDENEIPEDKASKADMTAYFASVVPQYDRDRVYPSDIKKLIKWYRFMDKHDLLQAVLNDEGGQTDEEE